MEEQIEIVLLDLIDRPSLSAREIIDPENVRELAESIRESGLLEPIILNRCNGRFEIIAGDRRYLAHRLLGMAGIQAVVKEVDHVTMVLLRGIENLQRVDLTPSEEARTYATLKKDGGLSAAQIAKKTGRALNTIKKYLVFWELPEEVRRAVDRRQLSMNCLDVLLEISDPVAFKYYFDMAAGNGITEKTARLWVDDYVKSQAGEYYASGEGGPGGSVDVELKPVFVTCECCLSPVEIKVARSVTVCGDCSRKARGIFRAKS